MLTIECREWDEYETLEPQPKSWYVRRREAFGGVRSVIIAGFHRRTDAEIAMSALMDCGIDWSLSEEELAADIVGRGGRKWIKKIACEHLQW